jgi:hypothetical protein
MNYITIDTLIARAQTTIATSDPMDRNIWREWVWMGLQDLGLSDEDVKTVVLYPKNGLAKKPEDMRSMIDLSLYDSSGNQLTHKFHTGGKRIYEDQRLYDAYGITTGGIVNEIPVDVSEDRWNIVLGTNGDHVYSIILRYFSYPIDPENGLPLIREDETMALLYFIRFMWAMRKDDNRSEIAEKQRMWYMESDRVKARKKMESLSPEKAKAIMRNWMRMIPSYNMQQY